MKRSVLIVECLASITEELAGKRLAYRAIKRGRVIYNSFALVFRKDVAQVWSTREQCAGITLIQVAVSELFSYVVSCS